MSVGVAEAACASLLRAPAVLLFLPSGVRSHLRAYYLDQDRALVRALPDCTRYDPGLFYTLRPGRCRFANRECDTEPRVNSQGLRDDEGALLAPEVIALGHSFTMGWGVAQEQAFPQVLRRLSGRRGAQRGGAV